MSLNPSTSSVPAPLPVVQRVRAGTHHGDDANPNNPHDLDGDTAMELLMRHSSPFTIRDGAVVSPLTERTSSPSFFTTTRPRSNPRTRTTTRYISPLQGDAFRIVEEQPTHGNITIRPSAGRAVGTSLRPRTAAVPSVSPTVDNLSTVHPCTCILTVPRRVSQGGVIAEERPTGGKNYKQGPSHRKVRRWNNDNFVNLAAEINSGNKGGRAAQALLLGQANAAHYHSITNIHDHQSHAMRRLQEDQSLKIVREQFFDGELHAGVVTVPPPIRLQIVATTPEEMLLRIEPRVRRVVIKACENSMPASSVVDHVERFLVRAHRGKNPEVVDDTWWQGILLEPPSVTIRQPESVYVTRFVFDGDSPNGGFHRLLMHGLSQFHGLKASSSTTIVTVHGKTAEARLLVAVGTVSHALRKVKLVEHIMRRMDVRDGGNSVGIFKPNNVENALQV
jgi:hypothetical protein